MYGTDFDLADWAHLPPLDDADLPSEPPPARDYIGGITLGSDLESVRFADHDSIDLGAVVSQGFAAVQPGLAELARLGSTDFDTLGAVGRVDALILVDQQQAWLEARKQELLALISIRDRTEQHWCVEEVGAALGLSGGVARTRLAHAEQLVTRLPATLNALSTGIISALKATAITEASFGLGDDLLSAFENRVLVRAEGQSITALKRSANRAVIGLDPATADQKHQHAVADRHVRIAPAEHGMAWLIALLPAEAAQTIYTRLTDTARATARNGTACSSTACNGTACSSTACSSTACSNTAGGDNGCGHGRNLDQLRADTLTAAVLHGVSHSDLPTRHNYRPSISVIVGLTTLAGQDNDPGWLDNYGPITADHARRIAHDPTGTWRRLITDPASGQLLDYGTTRYKPPQHVTDHVIVRDGECTFPYCTHAARRSDLDHLRPYPDGPTAAGNLHPLHRRHHNAKTHAGWRPYRNPRTGHTSWTSPQGKRYQTQPPERWTTPSPEEPPPF